MLPNGNDEAIEKMLDAREKNKTVVLLLSLILMLLSLFLLVSFLQNSQIMVIDTSSKEIPSNEIKNFSIPEIMYKSFEDRLTRNKNANFKIMTSVEKFNNMTFIEKNKELADIQKNLRNREIEKECSKDFYELSNTIYCRKC